MVPVLLPGIFPAQLTPQSLHLSPTFKHLLKEQKISYPMHVSGHKMVEWVQGYACAKLSETVWLAGGELFMGTTVSHPIMPLLFAGAEKARK